MGEKQCADGFCVLDVPLGDHIQGLGQGHAVDGEDLVGIQLLAGGAQFRRQKEMNALVRMREHIIQERLD